MKAPARFRGPSQTIPSMFNVAKTVNIMGRMISRQRSIAHSQPGLGRSMSLFSDQSQDSCPYRGRCQSFSGVTSHGNAYNSILHPDNASFLEKQGYYDQNADNIKDQNDNPLKTAAQKALNKKKALFKRKNSDSDLPNLRALSEEKSFDKEAEIAKLKEGMQQFNNIEQRLNGSLENEDENDDVATKLVKKVPHRFLRSSTCVELPSVKQILGTYHSSPDMIGSDKNGDTQIPSASCDTLDRLLNDEGSQVTDSGTIKNDTIDGSSESIPAKTKDIFDGKEKTGTSLEEDDKSKTLLDVSLLADNLTEVQESLVAEIVAESNCMLTLELVEKSDAHVVNKEGIKEELEEAKDEVKEHIKATVVQGKTVGDPRLNRKDLKETNRVESFEMEEVNNFILSAELIVFFVWFITIHIFS